jgi:hypothetical protein
MGYRQLVRGHVRSIARAINTAFFRTPASLIAVICNGQLSSPAWALPETPPCNGHSNADY